MGGSLCDLTEDVVLQILLRLPAESLLLCKCVSKYLNALINDPAFVAKHLHNSKYMSNMSSTSTSLLFSVKNHVGANRHRKQFKNAEFSRLTMYDDGDDDHPVMINHHGVDEVFKLPIDNDLYVGGTQCNGIVLMCKDSFQAIGLCNPTSGKLWLLPDACPADRTVHAVGFGYDSRANEYKVVRITSSSNYNINSMVYSAHIYKLSSSSSSSSGSGSSDSWRGIEMPKDDNLIIPKYSGNEVYCKGVYYWMPDQKILSFDMRDEKFDVKPLPEYDWERLGEKLMLWNNDRVALLIYPQGRRCLQTVKIEMWVLMDIGDDDDGRHCCCCWTKHLSIGPLICFYRPLSFWKSDELLFISSRHSRNPMTMASYNLGTQKLRDVHTPFCSMHEYEAVVIPYVKSPVSFHMAGIGNKPLSALPCKPFETNTSATKN